MIERQDRGTVAILQLRHGKANAIDRELFAALERELDAAADAAAVVLTGSGGIFSAGVDLYRVRDGGPEYAGALVRELHTTLMRLYTHPRPVVAAVNGHAIAGGCILAAACDRRVAAAGDARLGVSELRVGVPYPTAPLEILRGLLAPHVLSDLVLSARLVGPDEALRLGLVDEVVPAAALLDRAVGVAGELAAIPPPAYAAGKRALREPVVSRIEDLAPELDVQVTRAWQDPATREAIARFLEANVRARQG
jgi:enoyl-CoA hydratase